MLDAENAIETLTTDLGELQSNYEGVSSAIAQILIDYDQVKQDVTNLQIQVQTLSGQDFDGLSGIVHQLVEDLDSLESTVDGISGRVYLLETGVQSNFTFIERLQEEVDGLLAGVSGLNG